MEKRHSIERVRFHRNFLRLVVDGKDYEYALETVSQALAGASKAQRETFEISPGGYGIHWPLIDEDLSIDGLLRLSTAASTGRAAHSH
jgi:hypothetical protein